MKKTCALRAPALLTTVTATILTPAPTPLSALPPTPPTPRVALAPTPPHALAATLSAAPSPPHALPATPLAAVTSAPSTTPAAARPAAPSPPHAPAATPLSAIRPAPSPIPAAAPPAAQEAAGSATEMRRAVETITAADLRFRIQAIAHDSTRGRATPSPELDKVARHIARRFEEFGLLPANGDSYLQEYPVTTSRSGSSARGLLQIAGSGGGTVAESDYVAVPGARGQAAGPLAVVSLAATDSPTGAIAILRVTPDDARLALESVREILEGGAVAVLLALDVDEGYFTSIRRFLEDESAMAGTPEELGAPVAVVRAAALPQGLRADLASGTGASGYEATVRTHSDFDSNRAFNTIGWIEGSDPALREEFVILTAHMDHLGVGRPVRGDSIYNGADDDGSGTAAIIELAEAFASLPTPPRRSIAFMLVSGEERGLLGSGWYAENPLFPLEATVANLNIDMIGRNWRDTVVAIGRRHSTLGATLDATLRDHPELGLDLIDDPWPRENFFGRSDHYSFARKGVPVLFFFSGTHEDYHGVDDEPDRILHEKTARIARLIFHLAHRLADTPDRPQWDPAAYRQVVENPQRRPQ